MYFFSKHPSLFIIACIIILIGSLIGFARDEFAVIFLPGTQVGTIIQSDAVQVCGQCHNSNSQTRPVTISQDWYGSMMAHSARDPMFYAALAVANKYNNVAGQVFGEYCIRCHSPMGWFAGNSEDASGQSLTGTDYDGVQCDYCHRLVDPLNPDTTVPFMTFPVPGYGNGMHVMQRFSTPKRGPRDSVLAPHETMGDAFQRTSEMCGVCHDVSNPFHTQGQDRIYKAPYEYAPLERTYSEWAMSWYATQGDSGTCQSCHMTPEQGYSCVYASSPLYSDLAKHDLTGGNTFIPDILPDFWTGLDTSALALGKQRAISTLQRAAELDIESYRIGDSVFATVRVTNLTGHKLPTGYPDGRRIWINIIGRDPYGNKIFESGMYDADSAILQYDNQLKIYEMFQGLTDSAAMQLGLSPGSSFHFILNDTTVFDNRIPPRGFTNAGFELRLAQPVGVTYADSQYWDDTRYILPESTIEVNATLFYQTISKEYVEFLRDENIGNSWDWNNWGSKLYQAWETHGKSQPVAMESKTITVRDSIVGIVQDDPSALPTQFELFQNYPNPFNPVTHFRFSLPAGQGSASGVGLVTLKVLDITGKEVKTVLHERKHPGTYEIEFDGSGLPSGMYLYSLSVNGKSQTKKMLLLK